MDQCVFLVFVFQITLHAKLAMLDVEIHHSNWNDFWTIVSSLTHASTCLENSDKKKEGKPRKKKDKKKNKDGISLSSTATDHHQHKSSLET
jgi:hypothetical protein